MMDVETADHNHKETQNCSMVLDKSRRVETADHNHNQNCSMVLDESRKVETLPSSLLSSFFSLFLFLPLCKFVYKR